MGGGVRGAIAFALINEVETDHAGLLKFTVLGLVFFTTIVIGILLPWWVKLMDPREDGDSSAKD